MSPLNCFGVLLTIANMDITQMPIVDGLTSTKMIRAFEQEQKPDPEKGRAGLLTTSHRDYRIPIIAVSASLVEREKDSYVGAGFDGWILKPIDFRRLETLIRGIVDDQAREANLYVPGQWERGGWFKRRAKPQAVQEGGSDGLGAHLAYFHDVQRGSGLGSIT